MSLVSALKETESNASGGWDHTSRYSGNASADGFLSPNGSWHMNSPEATTTEQSVVWRSGYQTTSDGRALQSPEELLLVEEENGTGSSSTLRSPSFTSASSPLTSRPSKPPLLSPLPSESSNVSPLLPSTCHGDLGKMCSRTQDNQRQRNYGQSVLITNQLGSQKSLLKRDSNSGIDCNVSVGMECVSQVQPRRLSDALGLSNPGCPASLSPSSLPGSEEQRHSPDSVMSDHLYFSPSKSSPQTKCSSPEAPGSATTVILQGENLKIQTPKGLHFQKNMVYAISSPEGKHFMVWNGNNLEPMQETVTSTSKPTPRAAGQIVGGGVKRGRGRPPKGNAIGLNMVNNNRNRSSPAPMLHTYQSPSSSTSPSTSTQNLLPNGVTRIWRYANSPITNVTVVSPCLQSNIRGQGNLLLNAITPTATPKMEFKSPKLTTSSRFSTSENTPCPNIVSSSKRILSDNPLQLGICGHCGHSSADFAFCDSCGRQMPSGPKLSSSNSINKKTKVNVEESSHTSIDKNLFYGESSAAVDPRLLIDRTSPQNVLLEKAGKRGGRGGRRGRGKSSPYRIIKMVKNPHEPVTVTISSDEDDDDSKSNVLAASSPAHHPTDEEPNRTSEDTEADLFPKFDCSTTSRSFAPSRVRRMEDEEGRVKLNTKRKPKNKVVNPLPRLPLEDILLDARHVRIGSLRTEPKGSIIFSKEAILFNVICEGNPEDLVSFHFFPSDVLECEAHFGTRTPVMFFHTTVSCGMMFHKIFNMNKEDGYFDPESDDERFNQITLLLDLPLPDSVSQTKQLMSLMFEHYKTVGRLETQNYIEITLIEVNAKLLASNPLKDMEYIPKVVDTTFTLPAGAPTMIAQPSIAAPDNQADNTQPSSEDRKAPEPEPKEEDDSMPTIGFSGPVEKLLTYPAPPAKGGIQITNEDMYCLNEGEFLNDVIIDFYLKYIFHEVLNDVDRKRTHIFSSFFYKRLMQKQSRQSMTDGEMQASIIERRHARVKTWTRHVDLFQKDFVIIPINEHSHWFLAIICYPGKLNREFFSFEVPPETESSETAPSEVPPDPTPIGDPETMATKNECIKEESPMETGSVGGDEENEDYEEEEIQSRANTPEEIDIPVGHAAGCRQACILLFDSLSGPSRSGIVKTLREYLQVEWKYKKPSMPRLFDRDTIRGGIPKVPQQDNYSDCGVFILQYVETFFKNPINDYRIPIRLPDWFSTESVSQKRVGVKELILQLEAKLKAT